MNPPESLSVQCLQTRCQESRLESAMCVKVFSLRATHGFGCNCRLVSCFKAKRFLSARRWCARRPDFWLKLQTAWSYAEAISAPRRVLFGKERVLPFLVSPSLHFVEGVWLQEVNQIEGLASFTPRLHRCRGDCRENQSAPRTGPKCLCRAADKVCAALRPALVKKGGGRGTSFICVRRVDTVWNRFDRNEFCRWQRKNAPCKWVIYMTDVYFLLEIHNRCTAHTGNLDIFIKRLN